jgi:hypothetical protein
MKRFEYRTPRFLVDLPILFTLPESSIAGRCIEIGKEGMKVELEQPVSLENCGTVSVTYQEVCLELRVSVAHSRADFYGLRFLFESDKDRTAVERLVALLSGPKVLSGSAHSG